MCRPFSVYIQLCIESLHTHSKNERYEREQPPCIDKMKEKKRFCCEFMIDVHCTIQNVYSFYRFCFYFCSVRVSLRCRFIFYFDSIVIHWGYFYTFIRSSYFCSLFSRPGSFSTTHLSIVRNFLLPFFNIATESQRMPQKTVHTLNRFGAINYRSLSLLRITTTSTYNRTP